MTVKELFEQLISQIDPDNTLINEDKKSELIQLFEEKISEIKEKSFEDALDTIDEEHSAKLQNVISIMESMDEDHANKFKEIVEDIDNDHSEKLQEIIESIDEDHTSKFKNALDAIDEEHSATLKKVLSKIDEEHTAKLQKVMNMYEEKESGDLSEQISDYLDVYLENVKPATTIVNEERLNKLETTFEQLRNVLMVNDEYVQTEVKEAIIDAKNIIEEKEKEVNRLMLEKVEMNKKVKLTEAKIADKVEKLETERLLEDKIKGCSPKLQAYLELCFEHASKDDIEEKFDEAVEAFKQTEAKKREAIIESHQDRDDDHVIPESIKTEGLFEEQSSESQTMNIYANLVNKTTKSRK